MGKRQTPRRTSAELVRNAIAVVLSITPIAIATAAGFNLFGGRTWLLLIAGALWLVISAAFLIIGREAHREQRRSLRRELAQARQARNQAGDAFKDQLLAQQAILNRIVNISGSLLTEGIVDPQRAINNVRLIQSHARDARVDIENAITETRVGVGGEQATLETVDIRDTVEKVSAPFARRGVAITTAGPRLFGTSDPTMLRVAIRSLISHSADHGADQIDLTVASHNDTIVCTISDNGPDRRRSETGTIPALAASLARVIGADLHFDVVMGRNQASVAVPAAAPPEAVGTIERDPLDVLGTLPSLRQEEAPSPPRQPSLRDDELIKFIQERERDRRETVAARRKHQLSTR